ncbi:hypothetical protein [Chelatococcus asaccharovorans]|uniref:Uncharacterized protein n=1 Tax=Chelatococcus asaccharovorans TaxID=28210 RepID=A0A2V3TRE9_9HYPH|nr:hypothetical protein [Chelatococcus asaccharovorans]MBS7702668.1 hypothetical protein [Chelatococcus asaccharovorans]PXW50203.1 hypothetical protein C7450_13015 [Chelatococcus asaccharovorans]
MSGAKRRRKNAIGSAFIAHKKEMRESFAWRYLPDNARRILDRLELEHLRHGGADNGFLKCTYSDFEEAGIRRASVALAIRQCVELGFAEITGQGQRSVSSFRAPSLYRLTYLNGWGRSMPPTDDWQRVTSDESAVAALTRASAARNFATQPVRSAVGCGVEIQNSGRANVPTQGALARP